MLIYEYFKHNLILTHFKNSGSSYQSFANGDHVQFLSGNNIDNICIRSIKLYDSYKNILEQLKKEKSKVFIFINTYSTHLKNFYRV